MSIDSYKKIIDACNQIEATRDVYEDCYSLLGSYIKTVADINIPNKQEHQPQQEHAMIDNIKKINELAETLSNTQIKEHNSEHD